MTLGPVGPLKGERGWGALWGEDPQPVCLSAPILSGIRQQYTQGFSHFLVLPGLV